MQSRALLMLLVALIMGGIAVVLVQSLLKQQKGGEVAVQTVKTGGARRGERPSGRFAA